MKARCGGEAGEGVTGTDVEGFEGVVAEEVGGLGEEGGGIAEGVVVPKHRDISKRPCCLICITYR